MPMLPIMLYFFSCWLVLSFAAYFQAWLMLPDIVLMALLYLFYYQPQLPLWRAFLPMSWLLDLSAQLPLGFYGLFYGIAAFIVFPLQGYWRKVSVFEQLLAVLFLAIVLMMLKFFLLYLIAGIPIAHAWQWAFMAQLLVWPIMRMLSLWFMHSYGAGAKR